jgi:hypothetical protein
MYAASRCTGVGFGAQSRTDFCHRMTLAEQNALADPAQVPERSVQPPQWIVPPLPENSTPWGIGSADYPVDLQFLERVRHDVARPGHNGSG